MPFAERKAFYEEQARKYLKWNSTNCNPKKAALECIITLKSAQTVGARTRTIAPPPQKIGWKGVQLKDPFYLTDLIVKIAV